MKKTKIAVLVVIVVLSSTLVSCYPGQGQAAGGWSGTACHEGIVYSGTTDGRVVAVNATNRDLLWSRLLVTEGAGGLGCGPAVVAAAMYTTPVVVDDFVYVGTYTAQGGRMYALSVTDGDIIWEYPRGGAYIGAIVGGPVASDDTLYVSSSDGSVHALALSTFTLRWKSEQLADKLWTSPSVVGDTVYVSTFDGHMYALSAETGELLDWSFEHEAGFASSPVIQDGIVYVGSFDNNLYAVEIGAGEPLWTFAGAKWFWAPPLVHEGVVYAGCLDGEIHALDAKTGEVLGEFDAGTPVVSSPVLNNDLLIVVDDSGTVYVFDLDAEPSGRLTPVTTVSIDSTVKSSFCAREGTVYVRGDDNQLYVVDIVAGWVSWVFSFRIEEQE